MKARFQIIVESAIVLDTELESRSRFIALHELLKTCGVEYDPAQFRFRGDWVEFNNDEATYRTSTRYG